MNKQICPYSKTDIMCERDLKCGGCEVFKEFCKNKVTPANKAMDYTQQYLDKPNDKNKW